MNIISKNFLCNNLSVNIINSKYHKLKYHNSTLNLYIALVKTYLIKEKNVKPQEKIWLNFDIWPNFLVWFIAAAELGLIIIILDPKSKSKDDILRIYDGIDYVIDEEHNIFYMYRDTSERDTIYASPESVLIYTTSSGSTGTPKLVKYTHEFLFSLAVRNKNVYNLLESDKCLHNNTLVHSSIVGTYFLPSLYSCEHHYYFNVSNDDWCHHLDNEKINWCTLFHSHLELLKEYPPSITHNLNIIAISKLLKEFKDNVLTKTVKVYSSFGCSEVNGPVLLSVVDDSQNDETIFYEIKDEFYTLHINDNELIIEHKNKKIHTGDKFYINNDGKYIHQGRLNLYTINNEIIDINQLSDVISSHYKGLFDLVVDKNFQMIYLRSDSSVNLLELNELIKLELGNNYIISEVLVAPRDEFVNSVKFNANGVRLLCRQKLSIEMR